jgi:hypothetical protein
MTTDWIWHGTSTEWNELAEAVAHNCTCDERPYVTRCAAHEFLGDQRALDRLLFTRRIAATLVQEEMSEDAIAIAQQ